jgi:hypothetical protein
MTAPVSTHARASMLAGALTILFGGACDRGDRADHSTPARDSTRAERIDTLWLDPAGGRSVITANTRESDLVQRFGASRVRRTEIAYAESDVADGTVLFPDDSTRRLEIVWHDAAARARPDFVRAGVTATRWVMAPGVRVGMSLVDLERVNGGPFTLSGVDPNTGALVVLSWDGGRLEHAWRGPARAWVQLAMPASASVPSEMEGSEDAERKLSSRDPALRRLDPRVDEITLGFISET